MSQDLNLKLIIEGALFAANKPLSLDRLGDLFDDKDRPAKKLLRKLIEQLAYECRERSYELKEVAGGFRFQVRQSLSPWVSRLWDERPQRYSRAMMETLALIAYRQPITRGEIEDVRGVGVSSNIIKTLQEREWVQVIGHKEVPGRPAMYATTKSFLDDYNLSSLDQLPTLAEIRDLEVQSQALESAQISLVRPQEEATADEAEPARESMAACAILGGETEDLDDDQALFDDLDRMEEALPQGFKNMLKGGIDDPAQKLELDNKPEPALVNTPSLDGEAIAENVAEKITEQSAEKAE